MTTNEYVELSVEGAKRNVSITIAVAITLCTPKL